MSFDPDDPKIIQEQDLVEEMRRLGPRWIPEPDKFLKIIENRLELGAELGPTYTDTLLTLLHRGQIVAKKTTRKSAPPVSRLEVAVFFVRCFDKPGHYDSAAAETAEYFALRTETVELYYAENKDRAKRIVDLERFRESSE